MKGKLILSGCVIAAAGAVKAFWFPVAMIGASRAAGGQLSDSDPAVVASIVGMGLFTSVSAWLSLAALAILAIIWWSTIRRGVKQLLAEES